MSTPGERPIGPDHRVVVITISRQGHVGIAQQDQFTEVEVRDYRADAPNGKHRSDRHGTEYRDILFPAPHDAGTPVTRRVADASTEQEHTTHA